MMRNNKKMKGILAIVAISLAAMVFKTKIMEVIKKIPVIGEKIEEFDKSQNS